jgi:hypothetical protein
VYSRLLHCSDLKVLIKLKSLNLLSEEIRLKAVKKLTDVAVSRFDSGVFDMKINSLLTDSEKNEVLEKIRTVSIPNLYNEIDDYFSDWNGEDPYDYFSDLESAITEYKHYFLDDESIPLLDRA